MTGLEQQCLLGMLSMSADWTANVDVTPTLDETALLLEGAHGIWAADIAEFFAAHHSLEGDAGRAWAWTGVAERVRHRERLRLAERDCVSG